MKKRIALSIAALSIGAALIPTSAQAVTHYPDYSIKNVRKSYTGAIYHLVKNGDLIGPAIVLEPGAPRLNLPEVKVNSRDDGLKVWQPAGSCLKVYGVVAGPVFYRVHKYYPHGYGRDVWVTDGRVTSEATTRVKILPGNKC